MRWWAIGDPVADGNWGVETRFWLLSLLKLRRAVPHCNGERNSQIRLKNGLGESHVEKESKRGEHLFPKLSSVTLHKWLSPPC